MDESLQEFEAELKALAPRSLDSRLVERVANELKTPVIEKPTGLEYSEQPADHYIARRWLSLAVFGMAASLTVIVAVVRFSKTDAPAGVAMNLIPVSKTDPVRNNPAETPAFGDAYKPVAASNVLYEMKEEGPAATKGDSLERRVRYRYVDTYTWKNPRNNASLTWSVPRDEIRVQPAQFN